MPLQIFMNLRYDGIIMIIIITITSIIIIIIIIIRKMWLDVIQMTFMLQFNFNITFSVNTNK